MAAPWITLAALMRRRQRSMPPPSVGLGQLLAGEAAHALRMLVHPAVLVPAVVVGATVFVLLGPATPGFVLGGAWRPVAAGGVALVGAVFANGLLRRSVGPDRPAAAAIAAVVLAVAGTLVVTTVLALVAPNLGATGQQPTVLDARLPIDPALALAGVLVVVAVTASALGTHLRVPTTVLFLAVGMVAGSDTIGFIDLSPSSALHHAAIAGLVLILFDGGAATDVDELRGAAAPGALLATLGVVVSAAIVAGLALLLLPIDVRTAWLIGAVVAPTDAAALVGLLRQVDLPRRLRAILMVESGGNDAMAVLLTVGILASWDAPVPLGSWTAFMVWQVVGAIAVGVAGGWLGARLVDSVRLPASSLYPVLAVATAVATYGATAVVGASGLLAAYVAGIVVTARSPRHRRAIRGFAEGLATTVEVGLFLVLGLLVDPERLVAVALPALVLAIVVMVAARPLSVLASLAGLDVPWRDVGVIALVGVRGAVPIILAIQALVAGIAGGQRVFDVVFFVVLLTLVVQAIGAPRIVAAMAPAKDPPRPATIEHVTSADVGGVAMLEVEVVATSPVVDRRLRQVRPPHGVRVLTIRRGETSLVPDGDTFLRGGDVLAVTVAGSDHEPTATVRTWLDHA